MFLQNLEEYWEDLYDISNRNTSLFLMNEASYYPIDEDDLNYSSNELKYVDAMSSTSDNIHLPQVQGVIYAEACKTCLVNHLSTDDITCTACLKISNVNQLIVVKNNEFYDNYEGLMLFEDHALPRASHIMFRSGINSEIADNAFVNQIDIYSRLYGR